MKKLAKRYPTCWALQYQADDRWRREQIPELHRTESLRQNKRVHNGYMLGASGDESEFEPDYPFDHLLWMSVNSQQTFQW